MQWKFSIGSPRRAICLLAVTLGLSLLGACRGTQVTRSFVPERSFASVAAEDASFGNQATSAPRNGKLAQGQKARKPGPLEKKIRDLEQRIDDLEELSADTDLRLGSRAIVRSYSAQSIDLGGELSSLLVHARGEDANVTGIWVTFFELYIRAQLDEDWSLFAVPGFYRLNPINLSNPRRPSLLNESPTDRNLILSRAQLEYRHDDSLIVNAGIIGTPHGVINRDYFIPTRILALTPLMIRPFGANVMFPTIINGARAGGRMRIDEEGHHHFKYGGFAGFEPRDSADLEFGLRAAYEADDIGLEVGANFGHGRRNTHARATLQPPTKNIPTMFFPYSAYSPTRNSYDYKGIDLLWRKGAFTVKSVAMLGREAGSEDRKSLYFQPSWRVNDRVALSYRFDYYDPGHRLGHTKEHVLGVAFDPTQNVRLHFDFHNVDLPKSRDTIQYYLLAFSLSF